MPSTGSSLDSRRWPVSTFALQHAEAEMHELAHGGTECCHLALPPSKQTAVLGPEVGVLPDADDGGHVEGSTQSGIAGPGQGRSPPDACPRCAFDRHQAE